MPPLSRARIIVSCALIAFIPLVAAGQDIDEAIKLFNALQFDKSRVIFEDIVRAGTDARIAEAYYYLARLSINPDSQAFYYGKVVSDHPQSRYADIACLEIAKINIGREAYGNAILTLQNLIKNYPDTKIKDEYLFWLGVSYIAVGQNEQGAKALKELISSYPKSAWSDRAGNIIANQEPLVIADYYTVQVGSYRNIDNARKYAETLKTQGTEVQVVEAVIKGITYYRVWVGRFASKEEARAFSTKLESQGIKGNVVKGY
jgi:tetratricopeptide (TPR) repeat protein